MAQYTDLVNKRIVITGGASGIGLATVQRFITERAQVVVIDSDVNKLSQLMENYPEVVGGICADVSQINAVRSAFEEIDRILGGIDILVANAGVSYRKPFLDISFEQWRRVIGVNLDGVFLCSQEAIRRMLPCYSGVILITASTNGIHGHQYYADYNASKAGLILLMKTLALEFCPWLRVNAVCPGYVLTPMQKSEYTQEMIEETNKGIPLKRHATPNEIAALFTFLASTESSYITGQAILIDGGETAGPFKL